jgi:hypothetical protein
MFLSTLKERCAGFILMTAIVPMALLGYLTIVFIGFVGTTDRARSGVRALDHFVNASIFNGYAWESLSSHAWRERHRWWAKIIVRITNYFQEGHCERSNRREQPVVDLVLSKKLHERTIR